MDETEPLKGLSPIFDHSVQRRTIDLGRIIEVLLANTDVTNAVHAFAKWL